MADDDTLLAMRIGPDPSTVRAIHRARQEHLPEQERSSDPSSLDRVVQRMRGRDELERARHEFRLGDRDE